MSKSSISENGENKSENLEDINNRIENISSSNLIKKKESLKFENFSGKLFNFNYNYNFRI